MDSSSISTIFPITPGVAVFPGTATRRSTPADSGSYSTKVGFSGQSHGREGQGGQSRTAEKDRCRWRSRGQSVVGAGRMG